MARRYMNLTQFVDKLGRSKLCSEQEIKELLTGFQVDREETTNEKDEVDQFCTYLINNKCLTKWQCDKLRIGKWKGFYFDHYLILEPIGDGLEHHYKIRDISSGRLMKVTLTTIDLNGPMKYELEDYAD